MYLEEQARSVGSRSPEIQRRAEPSRSAERDSRAGAHGVPIWKSHGIPKERVVLVGVSSKQTGAGSVARSNGGGGQRRQRRGGGLRRAGSKESRAPENAAQRRGEAGTGAGAATRRSVPRNRHPIGGTLFACRQQRHRSRRQGSREGWQRYRCNGERRPQHSRQRRQQSSLKRRQQRSRQRRQQRSRQRRQQRGHQPRPCGGAIWSSSATGEQQQRRDAKRGGDARRSDDATKSGGAKKSDDARKSGDPQSTQQPTPPQSPPPKSPPPNSPPQQSSPRQEEAPKESPQEEAQQPQWGGPENAVCGPFVSQNVHTTVRNGMIWHHQTIHITWASGLAPSEAQEDRKVWEEEPVPRSNTRDPRQHRRQAEARMAEETTSEAREPATAAAGTHAAAKAPAATATEASTAAATEAPTAAEEAAAAATEEAAAAATVTEEPAAPATASKEPAEDTEGERWERGPWVWPSPAKAKARPVPMRQSSCPDPRAEVARPQLQRQQSMEEPTGENVRWRHVDIEEWPEAVARAVEGTPRIGRRVKRLVRVRGVRYRVSANQVEVSVELDVGLVVGLTREVHRAHEGSSLKTYAKTRPASVYNRYRKRNQHVKMGAIRQHVKRVWQHDQRRTYRAREARTCRAHEARTYRARKARTYLENHPRSWFRNYIGRPDPIGGEPIGQWRNQSGTSRVGNGGARKERRSRQARNGGSGPAAVQRMSMYGHEITPPARSR
ncbi:splicing factor, arginine/serine-rich 19-like [Drosophila obscura]|uniref:splicing factor, arginine/serine-rich 19-like n=1 Tax=Drosophila obscura TaxID=7282 RepID=UPI001BB15F33|nr:splicing factor, arginine/serine-rich 19-like [Drosophila obscura]